MAGRPLVYELYTGKTKVWCSGRFFTGTDFSAVLFSWGAIVATSTLFFVFSGPFLWTELSPAVVIIAAYLTFTVVANLLWAGVTDPGICPRALRDEGDHIIKQPDIQPNVRAPPRVRTAVINNREFEMRYCYTCHQYRLPRDTHCSSTDDCVDTFDHFCPWVNNAIGHRNYRYFFWFTVSLITYDIYIFAFSVYHLVEAIKDRGTVGKGLAAYPSLPIVLFISFCTFFPISGLASYHVDLVAHAITTNESLKVRVQRDKSPYDRGSATLNMMYYLFGPRRAPLMRWREPASLYDLQVWTERTGDMDKYRDVMDTLEAEIESRVSQPAGLTKTKSALSLVNQVSSSYANGLDDVEARPDISINDFASEDLMGDAKKGSTEQFEHLHTPPPSTTATAIVMSPSQGELHEPSKDPQQGKRYSFALQQVTYSERLVRVSQGEIDDEQSLHSTQDEQGGRQKLQSNAASIPSSTLQTAIV
eukprot:m.65120 g.65120  ORF g.65120 m.65120 type:complete len:475 (-) comp13528_c0_seq1:340-1764(-)